jgi:hypothetical protein
MFETLINIGTGLCYIASYVNSNKTAFAAASIIYDMAKFAYTVKTDFDQKKILNPIIIQTNDSDDEFVIISID